MLDETSAPAKLPERKLRRSEKRVAIWIPVVVAIITGLFGLSTSIATGVITYQTTISQIPHKQPAPPALPQLNSSYSGSMQTDDHRRLDLNLVNISENPLSGDFQGDTTRTCSGQVVGVVTLTREIDFDLTQDKLLPSCIGLQFEFEGTIDPTGHLSGTYVAPNTSGNSGEWFLK